MTPDTRLRQIWPAAQHIRHEGRCDVCHRETLWSFTTGDVTEEPREGLDMNARCAMCRYMSSALDTPGAQREAA